LAMCDLGCMVSKSVYIMNARSKEFARRIIGNGKKKCIFIYNIYKTLIYLKVC